MNWIYCLLCFIPSVICGWFNGLSDWYASFGPCTINEKYKSDIEIGLFENVQGQHIAVTHAKWAMISHLADMEPRHALSMVLSGTTGTGKNLVSSILADSVFPKDKKNIILYAGRQAFPEDSKVAEYRNKLVNDVQMHVKQCPNSIFVFDEIDKMPENLLDAVKPFLDFHSNVNSLDYRRVTFIFLTNIGGLEINTQYLKLREQGVLRANMLYSHFEHILRRILFSEGGLLKNSLVIADHLLSFYIPFLPLEKYHVKQCITVELMKRNLKVDEETINRVIQNIDFNENGLSKSGCKRVPNFVAIELIRSREEL